MGGCTYIHIYMSSGIISLFIFYIAITNKLSHSPVLGKIFIVCVGPCFQILALKVSLTNIIDLLATLFLLAMMKLQL